MRKIVKKATCTITESLVTMQRRAAQRRIGNGMEKQRKQAASSTLPRGALRDDKTMEQVAGMLWGPEIPPEIRLEIVEKIRTRDRRTGETTLRDCTKAVAQLHPDDEAHFERVVSLADFSSFMETQRKSLSCTHLPADAPKEIRKKVIADHDKVIRETETHLKDLHCTSEQRATFNSFLQQMKYCRGNPGNFIEILGSLKKICEPKSCTQIAETLQDLLNILSNSDDLTGRAKETVEFFCKIFYEGVDEAIHLLGKKLFEALKRQIVAMDLAYSEKNIPAMTKAATAAMKLLEAELPEKDEKG